MATWQPSNEDQVVEALRGALETHAPGGPGLEIRGGSSKADVGAPDRSAQVLSMASLTGILSYDPAELVMTLLPGTPLAEVQAAVAEQNQHLAFEPYGTANATIGGTLAAGIAGSRRLSAGGARDHLLGFRAVSGRGEVFVAGGKVVKNVTGYDLSKLMCGSWGRLAALTEVTVKIVPAPQTRQTLAWRGLDAESAWAAMALVMGLPADVAATAFVPARNGEPSMLLVRVEGFAQSVEARATLISAKLAENGAPETRDGTPWQAMQGGAGLNASAPLWRISVPARQGLAIASKLGEWGADWFADWAGGMLWAALDGHEVALRQIVTEAGGHAALMRAPAGLRARVPALHIPASALAAINARVRRAFDPAGLFETGRFLDTPDAD